MIKFNIRFNKKKKKNFKTFNSLIMAIHTFNRPFIIESRFLENSKITTSCI